MYPPEINGIENVHISDAIPKFKIYPELVAFYLNANPNFVLTEPYLSDILNFLLVNRAPVSSDLSTVPAPTPSARYTESICTIIEITDLSQEQVDNILTYCWEEEKIITSLVYTKASPKISKEWVNKLYEKYKLSPLGWWLISELSDRLTVPQKVYLWNHPPNIGTRIKLEEHLDMPLSLLIPSLYSKNRVTSSVKAIKLQRTRPEWATELTHWVSTQIGYPIKGLPLPVVEEIAQQLC